MIARHINKLQPGTETGCNQIQIKVIVRYRDKWKPGTETCSSQIQIQLAFRYRDEWHSGKEKCGSYAGTQTGCSQCTETSGSQQRQVKARNRYMWKPDRETDG